MAKEKLIINGEEVDPDTCTKVNLKEHMTAKAVAELIKKKRLEQTDARQGKK